MTSRLPMRLSLLLVLGISAAALRAEEPVRLDEARVRTAIIRSLDFLAREGEVWMNERDCNACHHTPLLLWSQRAAARRGFAVDHEKFAEWVEWTDARAKKASAGLEMMAFLKLAMPEAARPEITKLILGEQQADGSWKPGGQFATMQRRDTPEAVGNSARIILLGLATQGADSPATDAARMNAAALLEKSEPSKSVETLVFRLLYAWRFGPPEEAEARRAEILKVQNADGGWAWMIGERQSDSLATGEVLYALQQAPAAASADAAARAQAWLLSQQREDGGWSIDITRISRIDRSAPAKSKSLKEATDIYTFWGSAWATLGLLEGLPLSELHETPAPR